MSKERIISIIDIGSSKTVCLIAEVVEDQIQVIGVSTILSRGIKKGVVVDIDEAVEVISEAVEAAERMAGVNISRVWVTVNGAHISSVNSQGVVAISSADGEIVPTDVDRVVEAARAVSMPSSREIIHVRPRTYVVDSQEGIDDPVGMSGVRLQVETHIISGATTSIRNLVKCVQQIGLDVESLIFTGLASCRSLLSETEQELGVVMVDIGGGTTNIVVFVEGSPVYSSVLKLGGKNITSDIAIGLRVPLEDAEKIKEYVSIGKQTPALSKEQQENNKKQEQGSEEDDKINLSELGLESLQSVERKFLVEGIIEPRLEEIADEVEQEIKKSGYEGLTPAGIVLGGGAANTIAVKQVMEETLDLPVRVGEPGDVSGLIDEVKGPAYAASIGSLIYAAKNLSNGVSFVPSFALPIESLRQALDDMIKFIRGFIP